jgi:hypothetical protein
VTTLERRALARLWRALVPPRPGFQDRDLDAAAALLERSLPPRGRLGLRGAVAAALLLRPSFGLRSRSSYLAALAKHRLLPLRQVALALKGMLFLAALARPEARAALGVDRP